MLYYFNWRDYSKEHRMCIYIHIYIIKKKMLTTSTFKKFAVIKDIIKKI